MRVALQHLHGAAVADVLEAHSVGSHDLVPHLDPVLLSQTTGVQSETTERGGEYERLCGRLNADALGGGDTHLET